MNRDESTWLAIRFRHSLAFAQVTLSSVRLCISLRECDWFSALGNEIMLQVFYAFNFSKNTFIVVKIKCNVFYAS
jgi:hypothetical protein